MKLRFLIILILSGIIFHPLMAQVNLGGIEIDYNKPKEYEIGGITVSGVKYIDANVLIMLSGLTVGDRIQVPGDQITTAIKKLWDQGLFEDIRITATNVIGSQIFLDIYLRERPRLSKFSFSGIKKSDADNIRDKIRLVKGDYVTENLIFAM